MREVAGIGEPQGRGSDHDSLRVHSARVGCWFLLYAALLRCKRGRRRALLRSLRGEASVARPRRGAKAVAVGTAEPMASGVKRRLVLNGIREWWSKVQLARLRHRPQADVRMMAEGAERVTLLAVAVNILLAVVKLVAGLASNSAALVADAGHSVSDLISDGVTLWAVRMAQIPPDEDHPYGHGRFEAVGALGVSILVLAAGLGIAVEALALLRDAACASLGPLGVTTGPGMLALAACIASIVSKELLFRATDTVGRRLNSPVIRANALHHRSDVWSSVVAVVGVLGAQLGLRWLDPLAAVVVAAMVIRMGAGAAADALGQLTDTTDEAIVAAVERAARSVEGTTSVCDVRARAMGSHWLVDMEVVPDEFVLSASAADHLALRVRQAVLAAVKDAKECLVRVRTSATQCPMVARLPTPQEIDSVVRHALETVPDIKAVARTMTHFDALAPSVEILLEVSPACTVSDGRRIAENARNAVLASRPGLSSVEVHLALA